MGKILVDGGSKNVPVGKTIAILAEEGDDLNNLEGSAEGASKPKAEESAPKKDDVEAEKPKEEAPKEDKAEAQKPKEETPVEKSKEEPKKAAAEQSQPKASSGHTEIDPSISIFPAAERL